MRTTELIRIMSDIVIANAPKTGVPATVLRDFAKDCHSIGENHYSSRPLYWKTTGSATFLYRQEQRREMESAPIPEGVVYKIVWKDYDEYAFEIAPSIEDEERELAESEAAMPAE